MKKYLLLLLTTTVFAFLGCSDNNKGEEAIVHKLDVDKTIVVFASDGESSDNELIITSNSKWEIIVPDGKKWFQVSRTEGEGDAVIKIDADQNTSEASLSATITIKSPEGLFESKTVEIKQVNTSLDFDIFTKIKDERFKVYCQRYDINKDGRLTIDEAILIKNIYNLNSKIETLEGIEYFPHLTHLFCDRTAITKLDVSKNTELTNLDCSFTKISELDVSKNIKLTNLECAAINISELDVSKNINLAWLNCGSNSISELDISKNKKLKSLECNFTDISELDLSKNVELEKLECAATYISHLDMSKNVKLTNLECSSIDNISELDISKNTALERLNCSYNMSLSKLDVSKNTELKYLSCWYTPISQLDISKNTKLESLTCPYTFISNLDVSKNTELKALICHGTAIFELDISKNTMLTNLWCTDTPNLSTIYVWNGFNIANPEEMMESISYDEGVTFQVKQ